MEQSERETPHVCMRDCGDTAVETLKWRRRPAAIKRFTIINENNETNLSRALFAFSSYGFYVVS